MEVVKIGDFGISTDANTGLTTGVGTPVIYEFKKVDYYSLTINDRLLN